jgi:O-antigen/teichoic acid export membrane protein
VKFFFLIVFFYGFGLGISGVLYSMVLTPLMISIITLPWSWKLFKPLISAPPADEPIWKLVTSHRLWGVASSYLTTLTQNGRIWFIQFFLGTQAVAFYSFALGLFSQASALITFGPVTNPVLAQSSHDPERLGDLTMRTLKYHLWITFAALIPGIIITPFFIHWFFPAYAPAMLISMILLLALIPNAVNVATSAAYTALQKQRDYFFRATLVRSVSLVLLAPPLLFFFGLVGAAVEPIITLIISTIERARMLKSLLPNFKPSFSVLFTFDTVDRALTRRLLNRLRFQNI